MAGGLLAVDTPEVGTGDETDEAPERAAGLEGIATLPDGIDLDASGTGEVEQIVVVVLTTVVEVSTTVALAGQLIASVAHSVTV